MRSVSPSATPPSILLSAPLTPPPPLPCRFPGLHDQDVFLRLRPSEDRYTASAIRLQVTYLPTSLFGGFCEAGGHVGELVTMHANCCVGLRKKLQGLRDVIGRVEEECSRGLHGP